MDGKATSLHLQWKNTLHRNANLKAFRVAHHKWIGHFSVAFQFPHSEVATLGNNQKKKKKKRHTYRALKKSPAGSTNNSWTATANLNHLFKCNPKHKPAPVGLWLLRVTKIKLVTVALRRQFLSKGYAMYWFTCLECVTDMVLKALISLSFPFQDTRWDP